MKWKTIIDYVDLETGEITKNINKKQQRKIIITKTEKHATIVNSNGTVRITKYFTWSKQAEIQF